MKMVSKAVWEGERSWNGVPIVTQNRSPVLTRSILPGNPEDRQARLHRCRGEWGFDHLHHLPN
jgi:hypothetical protein